MRERERDRLFSRVYFTSIIFDRGEGCLIMGKQKARRSERVKTKEKKARRRKQKARKSKEKREK